MKRHPQPDLTQVATLDWARLAAYIDGEGCIRITTVKGAHDWSRRVMYIELHISNTDIRLSEWLVRIFGGAVHVRRQKTSRWATCYCWSVVSRRAADIIAGCLPYFIIKRDQADVALAFQKTIITDRRYGRKGRPTELLDQQTLLAGELRALKGTSSHPTRKSPSTTTIQ